MHRCVNIKWQEAGNQHAHPLIISLKTTIETYRCIHLKYYLHGLKQNIRFFFIKCAYSLYLRLRIFVNLSFAVFFCFLLTLNAVPITVK